MEDDNKCGHDACVCRVDEDHEFCSEHCEDASNQDSTEIKCDCGHSGCS